MSSGASCPELNTQMISHSPLGSSAAGSPSSPHAQQNSSNSHSVWPVLHGLTSVVTNGCNKRRINEVLSSTPIQHLALFGHLPPICCLCPAGIHLSLHEPDLIVLRTRGWSNLLPTNTKDGRTHTQRVPSEARLLLHCHAPCTCRAPVAATNLNA